MACHKIPADDEAKFGQIFGPGQVDQQVRQAIQMCWMMLAEDKRSVDEIEKQMRRILERALKDLREDGEVFKKQ